MSKGFFKSRVLMAVMASSLIFSSFGIQAYAEQAKIEAKTGEKLEAAEDGWIRYDDTDSKIEFAGSGWNDYSTAGTFRGTERFSNVGTDEIRFNFTGDKIRIISSKNNDRKGTHISIDGMMFSYNTYDDAIEPQILVFEKTSLGSGEHAVVIKHVYEDNSGYIGLDAIDLDENGVLNAYNEKAVSYEESISVESKESEVSIGDEFTTEIVLHNGKNICAEDIKISYDSELFEYINYEDVDGMKVYKSSKSETTGNLRFITASLGKQNAINGQNGLLRLRFKAKKQGTGKVDVTMARIADNGTIEKNILEDNCGEKEITVKGYSDVNRTGEFTLLDLGIDAWYYGDAESDTDTANFDTDVVDNDSIDEEDLSAIVNEIFNNENYEFNS